MIPKARRALVVVVMSLIAAAVVTGCGRIPEEGNAPASGGPSAPASQASNAVPGSATCEYVATGEAAKKVDLPPTTGVPNSGSVAFVLKTNEGDVTITMDRAKTPCTINSFASLAKQKYFDGTHCHRLSDSGTLFMLQCGDPTATGFGGPGYQFADETDPTDTYEAGTVAMANAGANTNGSQFFLVYQESMLPPNYTVFGKMDATSNGIVARIATEGQDGSGGDGTGKPNNPAEIISVTQK